MLESGIVVVTKGLLGFIWVLGTLGMNMHNGFNLARSLCKIKKKVGLPLTLSCLSELFSKSIFN